MTKTKKNISHITEVINYNPVQNNTIDTTQNKHFKTPSPAQAYRPDIDGLRAIAVLSVIIFHAFPTLLCGGFTGVDIFFVISGYLISIIIFRHLEDNTFSFSDFYSRRIRRIFPSLITVLTFVYVIGWITLLPHEFKQLGRHMASSTSFLQNFTLIKETGYFDIANELKPLMHLWSLAIEEQFYLFFPILIWGAWRLGLSIFTLITILLLLSFGTNLYYIKHSTTSSMAYFLPQTRFWELLTGTVLAYIHYFKKEQFTNWVYKICFHPLVFRNPPLNNNKDKILNNLISFTGLTLITIGLFSIHKEFSFPGWWAIFPVLGTFLLIFAGSQAWINNKILANKFMIYIGIISYPLYMWHWPLLSLAQIMEGERPSRVIKASAIILSLFLAGLTYLIIEKPLRFGNNKKFKTCILLGLTLLIGTVGFITKKMDGLYFRNKEYAEISRAVNEWDYPGDLISQNFNSINYFFKSSRKSDITLFIGDSNIEQYYPRIDELIKIDSHNTNSVMFKTAGGCAPIPGYKHDKKHSHCISLLSDSFELAKNKDVKIIVIGGQWNGYLLDDYGTILYHERLSKLSRYIKDLVALGKIVYLILNIPTGNELDPKNIISKRNILNFPDVFQIPVKDSGIERAELDKKYGMVQHDLEQIAIKSGAIPIKPMDFLCQKKCKSLDADGSPMYKDGCHLRPSYIRTGGFFIDKTVRS